ncbi:predicted protein [Streptomyces viridosporus ATCC 14672]|uniref:Predicted protein n=1 Tax=Streptomyces viridosporus (strain ATCC 14672 / DSM 40746 / JCM 4963 / KCTC 9882 / NRRL B-12104 / FH 1290) TaxID=566461 RepID=D5ZR80_STRV1|nr:predicted protein [Streptomyces viridosporus ATCC 14672]
MKKTTEDLWRESRPRTNGIEPSDAHRHVRSGTGHSSSTACKVNAVDGVKWLTDHRANRSTNPEISE